MTAQLIALTGEDVARLLEPELLIAAMEDAFRDLSAGRVSVPPRIAADAGEGSLIAMPGYANGALAAKLISWFGGNPSSPRAWRSNAPRQWAWVSESASELER